MTEPIKMPDPKPGPGQIVIRMGGKRYVIGFPTPRPDEPQPQAPVRPTPIDRSR